jgi:hypothetical protein
LIDAYPDAKVLLSVRAGETWARSMTETICGVHYGDTMMRDLSSARSRIDPHWREYVELMKTMWERSGLLEYKSNGEAAAIADAMERYNDDVKRSTDRLLVWSAAEGWEPLCAFLEVPVPDTPFPHVNDAGMFVDGIVGSALDALTAWREQEARPAPR